MLDFITCFRIYTGAFGKINNSLHYIEKFPNKNYNGHFLL